MNISRENTGDLTAVITVEIVEADYANAVEKGLKELRRKANIPGFRAGMVPMGMIKKMYLKSVMAEEVNKVLSESLNKYIADEKLDILGYPITNEEKQAPIDFDTQKEFVFHFDIGMSSDISLEINKDIHVPYTEIKVAETMVKDYLLDMQDRFGEHTHPEAIEENSKVTASFKQLDDEGNVVEGGISADNGSFSMTDIELKTIAKKLVGKKVGDKVTFDPMRAIKDATKVSALLAVAKIMVEDLKAEFEVEIKEILFIEPAEINEDLYKKAYPSEEIKDEKGLKKKIKEDAKKQFEGESDKVFLSKAVDILIEKADIKIPQDFMKRWILENNKGELTVEQLEPQFDSYVNTLKWQLLQNYIIKQHDLKVENDEVRNHIKGFISGQYFGGMENNEAFASQMDGIVDNVMKNEEEVKKVYDQLYDAKMLKLFKDLVSLDKEELSLDDFIKKASEAPQA